MKRTYLSLLSVTIIPLFFCACDKDFLDKKQSASLLVPTKLSEFQSLLDNTSLMNKSPGLQLLAGDELSPADNGYAAYKPEEKNSYIWARDIFEGKASSDWTYPYQIILVANVVLDGLNGNSSAAAETGAKDVEGQALFFRALGYFYLSQKFAKGYSGTAATDLGLPINLISDVNLRPGRGTLSQLYGQMTDDLKKSAAMLPVEGPATNRPARPAALAMLSRIYLLMRDYNLSLEYAQECLKLKSKLYDFNLPPFQTPKGNVEVLFNTGMVSYTFLNSTLNFVDQQLYNSYADDDLRKSYYFLARTGGKYTARGLIYSSNIGLFSGIALDEVYLNKAECLVRLNRVEEGIKVLNKLLISRWKTGKYVPVSATDQGDALKKVLIERKKELLMRGLRWGDLRRLNLNVETAVTVTKKVGGVDYVLLPNSPLYVFPIPDQEVVLSGIEQNLR